MNERDKAWANYPADNDLAREHWNAGYAAGHASAESKYAPALSAAEAERDLARGNELAIAAISAAHRTYHDTRDLHELARAVGQILYGPDDVQPESEWKTVERPGDADG